MEPAKEKILRKAVSLMAEHSGHWAEKPCCGLQIVMGKKPLALQGAREVDVYAMFFDQDTYDRYKLSKDDFTLLKEKEDKEKEEAKKDTTKKAVTPPKRLGAKFRRS
jgi:hypothetical protein